MSKLDHRFRLAGKSEIGVACDENGLFVGDVPVLERSEQSGGHDQWRVRSLADLNCELGECFGLPVEFGSKLAGLATIAKALGRGDVVHAQIAALHLQIPNPPALTKAAQTPQEVVNLARRLQFSGLLKADWNPEQHPRWPALSPDRVGGQFAPAGAAGGAGASTPSRTTAQLTWPLAPGELVIPRPTIPFPSEIVVPPVVGPNVLPKEVPRNPYPNRPECVAEWARAEKYCRELLRTKKLGRDGYRGIGNFLHQCLMGQVSEDCGGNVLEA